MENIFPEFVHKLKLYENCCDKTGKIVKNKDFYNQYKKTPHLMGRRGLTKDQKQIKDALKKKDKML